MLLNIDPYYGNRLSDPALLPYYDLFAVTQPSWFQLGPGDDELVLAQAVLDDIGDDSDWVVYMLKLHDDTLYTGITNNLSKRMVVHNMGKGSRYVRNRLPFRVVYTERSLNRSTASKREREIKKLTRAKKIELIERSKK